MGTSGNLKRGGWRRKRVRTLRRDRGIRRAYKRQSISILTPAGVFLTSCAQTELVVLRLYTGASRYEFRSPQFGRGPVSVF